MEFNIGDAVIVTLKDGTYPGVVCQPPSKKRVEQSLYIQIFLQKYPQWYSDKKVSKLDAQNITTYTEQTKTKVQESWKAFQDAKDKARSNLLSEISLVVHEKITAKIPLKNDVDSIETKEVISTALSDFAGKSVEPAEIKTLAYVPIQKGGTIDDLHKQKGLILVYDHIKPLAESKELRERIITLSNQCEELKNMTPEQKAIKQLIQENDKKWQARENEWKMDREGWKMEREGWKMESEGWKKEREGWKKEREESEKQTQKLKEWIENLTDLCEPIHKVYLGALFYVTRDKIVEAYRSTSTNNKQLTPLVHDSDIMNPKKDISLWCEAYLNENGLTMEDLNVLKKFAKEKRDRTCHNPPPKRVGDAISKVNSKQERDCYMKFFTFVYPNFEYDFSKM